MRTIINKLIFVAFFLFLSWKGLDGLIINALYSSSKTYDILQIEQADKLESRNIEISNGIPFKDDILYYESNQFSPVDIVYPLVSGEQIRKFYNSEPINLKVLVRLNNQNRDCLTDGNCIPNDSTLVKGLVKVGLENLTNSKFGGLESEFIKLDNNVILLEPNEEPIALHWNLVMFIVGTLFGFAILKSFIVRASTIEDYWKKITEKEES